MIGRIVEIAEDGRHLSVKRGFLVVSERGEELGRVPLDDVAAVVANAHGLTYSTNLALALSERNAPMVFCGPNHRPAALLWPVDGHHLQTARMRAQIEAGRPLCKRLWQTLIKAKIGLQGAVLEQRGQPAGAFETLVRGVRSGDPENLEAQAARRYWPLLFGEDFRRDTDQPGINGLLNYGYAIVRAATARSVMAAGLHPTLGIHHHNRNNPMCLVDDLMEPFRPIVDLCVARLLDEGTQEVDRDAKTRLAAVTQMDMQSELGVTPLSTCLERLALSLAQAYQSGEARLDLPLRPLPLDLAAPDTAKTP